MKKIIIAAVLMLTIGLSSCEVYGPGFYPHHYYYHHHHGYRHGYYR
ncbi:MAG: hypothetical protein JSS82_05905 [Bacteroidetes bacterium]|nr:hypothetical protein [Bacteroidota bacterium]